MRRVKTSKPWAKVDVDKLIDSLPRYISHEQTVALRRKYSMAIRGGPFLLGLPADVLRTWYSFLTRLDRRDISQQEKIQARDKLRGQRKQARVVARRIEQGVPEFSREENRRKWKAERGGKLLKSLPPKAVREHKALRRREYRKRQVDKEEDTVIESHPVVFRLIRSETE